MEMIAESAAPKSCEAGRPGRLLVYRGDFRRLIHLRPLNMLICIAGGNGTL